MSAGTIKEEIDLVKQKLPKIQFVSVTPDFLTAVYEKTPARRIKATLTFPKDYPHTTLIVSVEGNAANAKKVAVVSLAPGLKRKLDKELTQRAKDTPPQNSQILAVLEQLQSFIDTNRFVPCWRELKQSVDLIQKLVAEDPTAKGSALSIGNEAKGTIRLQLVVANDYKYACSITIDEQYPTTESIHDWGKACRITAVASSTNLPPPVATIITQEAQTFVRHLQDGMPEEEALRAIKTGEVAQQCLEDGSNVPIYDGSNPQPSLLPLVRFMVGLLQKLPQQTCPICQELSFPDDPNALSTLFQETNKKKNAQKIPPKRPMRPSCGCWFHYQCLHQLLTQPPFGEKCPHPYNHPQQHGNATSATVRHPDWTADRAELELTWANQQARQRELDDAAMF